MMKPLRSFRWLLALALLPACFAAAQEITTLGLRLSAHRGGFRSALYAADGSLLLLYDEGDGVRLLRTDAAAKTVLAQVVLGAAGDAGVAMAQDPAGDLYVAGTTTSGALAGSAGAAFPQRADASTNSFLARFDSGLHLLSLTLAGAGQTEVTGVAATADAVFITGTTYSASLPTTGSAIQPHPANGSTANGFVERFSPDLGTLVFATYLTGANGDTHPAAVAADSLDHAYVTGETSASGFPTVAALQPTLRDATAGFLTELSPPGDAFAFSTFIAGNGITGLALDPATNTLLLTGQVAPGEFPVQTVADPLANLPYTTLLRIDAAGGSVEESILLVPGTGATVTAGPGGTAWVSGALATPLGTAGGTGDMFLLHVSQSGAVDSLQRFGGAPTTNWEYANLTGLPAGAPAVTADGNTATLAATLTASVDASLAASEHFDLSLLTPGGDVLPGLAGEILPPSCSGQSQCSGSAGLLATVHLGSDSGSFSLSTGDSPNLIVRNLGGGVAADLTIAATGYTDATSCGTVLAPWAQCVVALSGPGPGSLAVSAANATTVTASLPASSVVPSPFALSTTELDFGVVTADSSPSSRTVTVTNLISSAQSFVSAADGVPGAAPYTLAELASTCAGTPGAHIVAANSSCTVTVGLSARPDPANDGPVRAAWLLGGHDVAITGVTQAAAVTVSSPAIDFGVRMRGQTRSLPRFLYLSNNSDTATEHTPVSLPSDSPFAVADACPSTLEAHSVCQLVLTYSQPIAPAADSATLVLDAGLTVLLTGEVLPPPPSGAGTADPGLVVQPSSLVFPEPVVITGLSGTGTALTLTNTGRSPVPLSVSVTGDFRFASGCPAALPAGASCEVSVAFAPSAAGVRDGLLLVNTGSVYAPTLVDLSGTAAPLLPANNGTLSSGQSLVGEPAFTWYRLQAPFSSFTASVAGSAFGVAIVEDDGSGHGTLPASAFAPSVTAACGDCWLGVAFIPQAAGPASGTLTLSSTAGGAPYSLALTGTGIATMGLVLTPTNPDFGTVPVGSASAPLLFTLQNSLSPGAAVTVANIAASGDFQVVSKAVGEFPCNGTLAATASCSVSVVFTPTKTGPLTGALTIATSAGITATSLSGSGDGNPGLALQPTSLNFSGDQSGGAPQALTVALTNTSATSLTIGLPRSSSASFEVNSSCATLLPGASCPVSVSFTPGNSEVSGALTVPVSTIVGAQTETVVYTVPLLGSYTVAQSGLLLFPSQIDFGAQAIGTPGQTRLLSLQNTSGSPQQVELYVPENFPLAAPFGCSAMAAGATCTFAVTFLPETGGPLTGSLELIATAPNGVVSKSIGYLLGYGEGAGQLTVSGQPIPDSPVDFGAVASGQTAQQRLVLTNAGTGLLTIRRLVSSPPFLTSTDCGQTLLPAAACTATLTYAPVDELASAVASALPRPDTGTLSIESDAVSSPDIVQLTGTALPISASGGGFQTAVAYTLSEGALTFPNTQVGDLSSTQTITVQNTGTAALRLAGVSAPMDYAAATTCSTVLPGGSCEITVTFAPGPGSASAPRAGTLALQSNSPNALEFVSLLGLSTPSPLTLSPLSLGFGVAELGSPTQLLVTASNTASLPITFGVLTTAGDFTRSGGSCPGSGEPLAAGTSCTLALTFTPTQTGARAGTLTVPSSAATNPAIVSLTGRGIAPKLVISPGSLNFGEISLGASVPLTLNLVNSGSATVTGLSFAFSGPDAANFAISKPCPATTYSAFAGCTMQISFVPLGTGPRTATLLITSSDPAGPIPIALSGTGLPGGGFTLTVNGLTAATATVPSGTPVRFPLTVTPTGGFAGSVALTCTPLSPAPDATCSLLNPQLTLGVGNSSAVATITTVSAVRSGALILWGTLLLLPLSWYLRKARRNGPWSLTAVAISVTAALLAASGCGGGPTTGSSLTPPGTYGYRVTASALNGLPTTSSVTLTMIVQ